MFVRENGRRSRGSLVPAVEKAFKLLDLLSRTPEPLGISELGRRLQMGKSTIYGLVTTLEALGALESADGTKRYRIGRGLQALAMRTSGRYDLRAAARPFLERLAADTEQTAFLGVPGTDSVTILDLVHGRPAMSVSAPVGSSIPLLAGAVGKAIVAAWEPARRDAFLAATALPRFTSRTLVDAAEFRRALDDTLARGAALDVDEYVEGMRAAASAVVAGDGRLVAVVWVAGFARHIDDRNLDRIAASVAAAARQISAAL